MTGVDESKPHRLVAAFGSALLGEIDGRVAQVIVANGVALALEPVRPDATMSARRSHALVMRLWIAGATLPGGVNSVFASGLVEARDWLSARRQVLRDALSSLQGMGEFVLSVDPAATEAEPSSARIKPVSRAMGGAAYLRARADAMEAATRRSDRFRNDVLSLELDVARRCPLALTLLRPRRSGGADLCVLAPKEGEAAIWAAARQAKTRLSVSASGPWPPYSFAAAALDGKREARAA